MFSTSLKKKLSSKSILDSYFKDGWELDYFNDKDVISVDMNVSDFMVLTDILVPPNMVKDDKIHVDFCYNDSYDKFIIYYGNKEGLPQTVEWSPSSYDRSHYIEMIFETLLDQLKDDLFLI
jgi:hypothetical protein